MEGSCASSKPYTTKSFSRPPAADDFAARFRHCKRRTISDHVAGAVRAQLGRLDGVVHTAAMLGSLGPIEHQSFDVWQNVVRVHLVAAMALTRAMLPR
jgi:NAD(P)-dependent dehydrogenase (short-subunit alcohol dehydrogenase family)